jgi:diaminopimelate epimerase
VNAEFIQVISPTETIMRVWERGSGETQACGTGACAAAVAGVLAGLTERRVLTHLSGGDLELEWSASGEVFMTGPAAEVFEGVWPD